MKRLDEFRIFYNKTIHPELLRMERSRNRLLRLLAFSAFLLLCIIGLQVYLGIFALTIFLCIPIVILMGYLGARIRRFVTTFKPTIINLILSFIDDGLNVGTLSYQPKASIPKETFDESGLFVDITSFYRGEDHISGRVGEMDFEMSELDIREVSPVSNRLVTIFKGIFLRAIFNEETEGEIKVWPREKMQYYSKPIKAFTWDGAINVDYEIMNDEFRDAFVTFGREDTKIVSILTDPMQQAIVDYAFETGKELFMAFKDQEIYIAITEPRDLLEPYIFSSNLSFELVRGFFEDVKLLLEIVEEFDRNR